MTEDEAAAKDIVQDIFIKLWLQRETLTDINNLTRYIQRLTRNHTINGLKRKAHEEVLVKSMHKPAGAVKGWAIYYGTGHAERYSEGVQKLWIIKTEPVQDREPPVHPAYDTV